MAEALPHAPRKDVGRLLEAGVGLLKPLPKQPWSLWPHRIDVERLQARILGCLIGHWDLAPKGAREAVGNLPQKLVREAVERGLETDAAKTVDWLARQGVAVDRAILRRAVLLADREASRRAAEIVVARLIRGLGLTSGLGDRLRKIAEEVGSSGASELAGTIEDVAELAERFEEHQQRDIMTAAMLLAEGPGHGAVGAVSRIQRLCGCEQSATTGLRAAIRRGSMPLMRERAWRWLASEPLRAAALDRVARVVSEEEHERVLSQGYLILRPVRGRMLRLIKVRSGDRGQGPEPVAGQALPGPGVSLSAVARRWLIDFSEAMQVDHSVLTRVGERGLCDRSAWVRFASMRSASPVDQVDFAFDGDERIARSAALARSPAGGCAWNRWPIRSADRFRMRTTEHLTRSPHAVVRWISGGDARCMNPWLVDCAESRLAARTWLSQDREGFLKSLRERVAGGSEGEGVAAIRLAKLLRLCLAIEPLLIALSGSENHRLAATAVAALGELDTATARAGIEAGLGSGDDRVRANALEARLRHAGGGADLADADPSLYSALMEYKHDGHHRVRANALRGLMERTGASRSGRWLDQTGLDGLASMLTDERPAHRIAALWLAERTLVSRGRMRVGASWEAFCRRVAAMAAREEAEAVRVRAGRCARRLLAEMRIQRTERVDA